MKSQPLALIGPAALACMLAAGCAPLPDKPRIQSAPSRAAGVALPAHRIAQLRLGAQLAYGFCLPPACPAVTPKTLVATALVPVAAEPARAKEEARTPEAPPVAGPERLVVYFAPGSSRLDRAAQLALTQFLPQARKSVRVVLMGRTDSTGTANFNRTLALARARAVEHYLRSHLPAPAPALELDAQGGCCYVADNATAAGRAGNRRVELEPEPDDSRAQR